MAYPARRLIAPLAAIALLSVSSVSVADEVTDQLDVAREAYEAGNLSQSVDELNYAISQIQEMLSGEYAKLLPDALAGWTAGEAVSQAGGLAMLGGGTSMTRSYTKDSGGSVEIKVYANSPMAQGMSMMLQNPMLMQMDPSTKAYRYKGRRGMIKHDAGSTSYEITMMLKNNVLLQVSGQGLADKAPVVDYVKAVDFKAMEEAFAG